MKSLSFILFQSGSQQLKWLNLKDKSEFPCKRRHLGVVFFIWLIKLLGGVQVETEVLMVRDFFQTELISVWKGVKEFEGLERRYSS